ncbi:MAG: glycosyl transferase family 1 [Candidatus Tectimicrobiota bacterium]|nr:MAG: glycosyl transferase family 1 [Candidatus Tectomicrobia bacterium]
MIEQYRGIAPDSVLREIALLAEALQGRSLLHVNATRSGGGVAELLARLVPWTEALGIRTTWEVISGSPAFFEVTKAMHNALQGDEVEIPRADLEVYLHGLQDNAKRLRLEADVVVVHDPQPAYLIQFGALDRRRAVWRCHIDLSQPYEPVWRFLRQAVSRYAMAVFHVAPFAQPLPIPQLLIAPSIDPLSEKNRELSEAEITAVTERFGIDRRRPLLVQISRFDRFKDPLGVIAAYRLVRQNFDCQLVLAGGPASDDPEGERVLAEVQEAAAGDPDIFVLSLPPGSDHEINALQRAATVVIQKSTREGFGLTVTEAMWKGKPVIGGAAGGIPAQVIHGVTGFLVHSPEGAAFRLRYLLSHPRAAQRMGAQGREHVRRHFLITRHVRDYLMLMLLMLQERPSNPLRLPAAAPSGGECPDG